MSKFVHKVKDAMTDHDRDARARGSQVPHDTYGSSNPPTTEYGSNQYNSSGMNPSSGMGSNNPYGSDPRSGNEPGTYDDSGMMGNRGGRSDPDTYGSTAMGGDDLTSATQPGSSGINAGPHDSKLANKMDPRVDSDLGKPC